MASLLLLLPLTVGCGTETAPLIEAGEYTAITQISDFKYASIREWTKKVDENEIIAILERYEREAEPHADVDFPQATVEVQIFGTDENGAFRIFLGNPNECYYEDDTVGYTIPEGEKLLEEIWGLLE